MAVYLLDCNHMSDAIQKVSRLRDRIQQVRKHGHRTADFRVIPSILESKFAIDKDGLAFGRNNPANSHVLADWNGAGVLLVFSIRWPTVDAQFRPVNFPIENNIICGVADAKVRRGSLGYNGDVDWRSVQ